MATYRVLDTPKPFGGRTPGEQVELTEAEAAGFLDKLALVSEEGEEAPNLPAPRKRKSAEPASG